jgi:outer membrane lipoprotein-sorting protein
MKITLLLFLTVTFIFLSACYKHTDPKIELTLVDINGKGIQGVTVNINSTNQVKGSEVNINKITSPDGKIYFSYPYECILELDINYKTYKSKELIQLKNNKVETKTILLK